LLPSQDPEAVHNTVYCALGSFFLKLKNLRGAIKEQNFMSSYFGRLCVCVHRGIVYGSCIV